MKQLKFTYIAATYQSFARTGADYLQILSSCHLPTALEEAEVIIMHCLPYQLPDILDRNPHIAGKYLIVYCVWEASELPYYFRHYLPRVQEVWTCSEYCRSIFARHHPKVIRVPHVVERATTYSEAEFEQIKRLLSHCDGQFHFLTVASLMDSRKNTPALLQAFCRVASQMPEARLIVKTGPATPDRIVAHDQVLYLQDRFSEGQMNALYSLADACVSAHHSEGWGLTLSDAMLFHKPVIATGYSGNLEFMNEQNSLLVAYREEFIHPPDRQYLFRGDMKWAYPDERDLEAKLLWAYQHRDGAELQAKAKRATEDIKQFSRTAVQELLLRHAETIPRA